MTDHTYLKGQVEKIRIVELEAMPLVRFTLKTNEGSKENCLIKVNSLNFLYHVA